MGLLYIASFHGDDGHTFRLTQQNTITCKQETHSIIGVHAYIEQGSNLDKRVTLTRLFVLHLWAVAFQKRSGGEKYLIIEGEDFAWITMVKRKHIPQAMQFMTAVNNQARKIAAHPELQAQPTLSQPKVPSLTPRQYQLWRVCFYVALVLETVLLMISIIFLPMLVMSLPLAAFLWFEYKQGKLLKDNLKRD